MFFKEKDKTINLNPILQSQPENNIINFNSIFLYIFLLFEVIIVILILYFFFQKEFLFIFNEIYNTKFTENDKNIYNSFMLKVSDIFKSKKYCIKEEDKYVAKYKINKIEDYMLNINNSKIYFNTEHECKKALNLEK